MAWKQEPARERRQLRTIATRMPVRTSMSSSIAGGPARGCRTRGHRKRAGRSWRNSQGLRAADPSEFPRHGWRQFATSREARRTPAGPPRCRVIADCRCRCSAVREVALAWPLPYAPNKLNWIFQFSFYEDNQDKGNNWSLSNKSSMQAQCKTRLHVALVTHIYRQTNGIRKCATPSILRITAGRPPGPIAAL